MRRTACLVNPATVSWLEPSLINRDIIGAYIVFATEMVVLLVMTVEALILPVVMSLV